MTAPSTLAVTDQETLALDARNVEKSFGGSHALSGVNLQLSSGEIHALLGENGSGKSTLIKILSGYHDADGHSEVYICGSALSLGSAEASYQLGARFIHQDLGLIGALSVIDNLALGVGYPSRAGTISMRRARAESRRCLDRVGLAIDPGVRVEQLTAAERTGVAVARALREDPAHPVRLLILDEPTATLPPQEVDHLFATLKRVAAQGIGILLVTHNIDEVFRLADTATVLRDGRVVASAAVRSVTRRQVVQWLIGKSEAAPTRSPGPASDKSPALEAHELAAGPLIGVTFTAYPGEVVGLAGLTGSGRETLLGALFGARPRTGGEVRVAGKVLAPGKPAAAMRQRIAYLSPNRKVDGGFLEWSAAENLTINDLRPYASRWWVHRRAERNDTRLWFERLQVRPPDGVRLPLAAFSGGNQQKILFGKWLRTEPRVFLLDEPTQGVDVGAKAELHQRLLAAADAGAAIVVSSTDVDELAALCTRVLVIRDGRIAAELTGDTLTRESVKRYFMATPDEAGRVTDHA